jgi:hypothetical protein
VVTVAKIKFPATIHIAVDPNWEHEPSFNAFTTVENAIDDDGPTEIADYRLVRVRKFRKDAIECK